MALQQPCYQEQAIIRVVFVVGHAFIWLETIKVILNQSKQKGLLDEDLMRIK